MQFHVTHLPSLCGNGDKIFVRVGRKSRKQSVCVGMSPEIQGSKWLLSNPMLSSVLASGVGGSCKNLRRELAKVFCK